MIILIPIFPRTETEKELAFETIEGYPLVLFVPQQAKAVPDGKVLVLSNQEKALRLCGKMGLDCHLMSRDLREAPDEPFPPGTTCSLEYVRTTLKGGRDQDLCLVDYRNPLLSAAVMQEAYARYRQSDYKLLFSVTKVTDHPVQLDAYYRVKSLEILSPLETEDRTERVKKSFQNGCQKVGVPSPEVAVTKPFYFHWKSHGIQEQSSNHGMYAQPCNEFNSPLIPVDVASGEVLKEQMEMISWMYRRGPDEACRLTDKDSLGAHANERIVAIPFIKPETQWQYVLIESGWSSMVALYTQKGPFPEDVIIRIWAFSKNNGSLTKVVDTSVEDRNSEENRVISFFGHPFLGPVCSFEPPENADAYMVCLLELADGGPADFAEPLQTVPPLWNIDTKTKHRTDRHTGRVIVGRQDFPDMFALDGSLAISNGVTCNHRLPGGASAGADGFVLAPDDSCKIRSKLDLVRLKALVNSRRTYGHRSEN